MNTVLKTVAALVCSAAMTNGAAGQSAPAMAKKGNERQRIQEQPTRFGFERGIPADSVGFFSSPVGNVEVVWSKAHRSPLPNNYGTLATLFEPLSGGGYILSGQLNGSYVNAITEDGDYAWSNLWYDVPKTGTAYMPYFSDAVVLDSGRIALYGPEMRIRPGPIYAGYVPSHIILSPEGDILNEYSRRDLDTMFGTTFGQGYAQIMPGRVLFTNGARLDTTEIVAMSPDLSVVHQRVTTRTMMKNNSRTEYFPAPGGGIYAIYTGKDSISIVQFDAGLSPVKRLWLYFSGGFTALTPTADGSFLFANTVSNTDIRTQQLHLKKYDVDGALLWAVAPTALSDSLPALTRILTTKDGGCLVLGHSYYRKTNGYADVQSGRTMGFMAKFDAAGALQWHYTSGLEGMWDRYTQAVETADGDIIAVNSSSNPNPQFSKPVYTVITRLRPKTTGVEGDTAPITGIKISPNPAAENFTVSCPENAAVTVRDVFGRAVYAGEGGAVSTSGWAAGVYFVEAAAGASRAAATVVVHR